MNTAARYTTIGYLIADLSRLFGRVFDRRSAHLGLTRVQWRALKRIHQNEGISQAELADLLDMEPIAVGRVIDRLSKAGFVERRPDPNDRRQRSGRLPELRVVAVAREQDRVEGAVGGAFRGGLWRMGDDLPRRRRRPSPRGGVRCG